MRSQKGPRPAVAAVYGFKMDYSIVQMGQIRVLTIFNFVSKVK